jgi:hypothetical protein
MMTTIHLALGPIGVSVSAGIRSTFDRVRIEFDRILAFDRYRIYGGHIRFDANLQDKNFLAFDSIRINGGHIRIERQGLAFDSIDS